MINYKSLRNLFTFCSKIATVIILFIAIGCQTPQNKVSTGEHIVSDSTLIQINVDPGGEESYAFDSLIDDISYIKLETNSDCLIGSIHQILCTKDYIFIMDVFVANASSVYTEECLINCYFSLGISDFCGQCLSEVMAAFFLPTAQSSGYD